MPRCDGSGVDPIIHDNAVARRGRTCENAGMTGCSFGRHIVKITIGEGCALADEALKTAITKIVPEPLQVIVTHLVYDDADDKPWTFRRCGERLLSGNGCNHQTSANAEQEDAQP
jgi:hypothetical protein